eukprot:c40043_g1_i1.p1 GENE.c40043_g1_i1~~c40043_g1_i1.p1  ORF type:complete len:259 (+),score=42.73 c40043_g1_i1:43-777(+)
MAKTTLRLLASFETPVWALEEELDILCRVSESAQWHVRSAMLKFLQPFLFRNRFLLSAAQLQRAQAVVIRMLADPQIEVRRSSQDTLAGILHMSGPELTARLCPTFVAWANTSVAPRPGRHAHSHKRVLVPEKLASLNARSVDESFGMSNTDDAGASIRRHAGILGLMAMVHAHPYDVPDWMPSLLVQLAEFVSEPGPISTTIKQGFNEFWRTHQDLWVLHQLRFSKDDLLTLTQLLVSPSYFA